MRWLAHSYLFLLLLASCATAPTPTLPIGEFYEQVLDPLAVKIANEKIDANRARILSDKSPGQIRSALERGAGEFVEGASKIPGTSAATSGAISGFLDAPVRQQLAELEARRYPLKQEILDLLVKRTKPTATGYQVCVDGKDRRYGVEGSKFSRQADGPGPCEVAKLRTLLIE